MRCVLALACVLFYSSDGLPYSKLDSVTPTVNGFLKTAYSRIEEADVKSLTTLFIEPYRALQVKFGAWAVSQELGMIYESQRDDLKISMARLNKLGSLLQRLEAETAYDGDDGEDSGRSKIPDVKQDVFGNLQLKRGVLI